jgi:CubicO group peptidase (beta-lactamase class C family)
MLQGYVHPDFWGVAKALGRQIPRSRPGGAAVSVYHRGELVVDLWGGTRDESGRPWESDTLALSYSTTKGVVSTLLHMMVDRGLLDYDEPVARYWPEFAQCGKERITVRHVLCHEAGLYGIRSLVDHGKRILDWDYMVEALADSIPAHPAGEAHGYHALTYGWLVGELIQRVAHRSFSELVQTEIAQPLELDGLHIGLPAKEMHRKARLIIPAFPSWAPSERRVASIGQPLHRALRFARLPIDLAEMASAMIPRGMEEVDFNSEAFSSVPIPAANGTFTARSLAKLYATLANGGEWGDAAPGRRGAEPRHRPRDPLPDALAARLPPRPHPARQGASRLRPFRLRGLGGVGGPRPQPVRGHGAQQRNGDALRRRADGEDRKHRRALRRTPLTTACDSAPSRCCAESWGPCGCSSASRSLPGSSAFTRRGAKASRCFPWARTVTTSRRSRAARWWPGAAA